MNSTLKQAIGTSRIVRDIPLSLFHTNARKRMKRNVSKKVRRSARTEIEQAVDDIMESRRDPIDLSYIEEEQSYKDILWMYESEMARENFEDELIARMSEEDYPQASGLHPEDMDTDEYRHYSLVNKIWD